ncbi:hypothetical protein ABW20_dc0110475 [Dactylellina cionopaga]|nr:hypothetical protein ABW20_dc0110475 [Dactylellina cionopaga]
MDSQSVPGGRATILTIPCNPPSAASSVYATSEASTETTTGYSGASFATNSTIGDYAFREAPQAGHASPMIASIPRERSNTLPTNPSTNTPLPLLQFPDGDTLLFLSPPPSTISPEMASRRIGSTSAPLRVLSSRLSSPVFAQLLSPSMQQRILTRLVKQKKIVLVHGKLPQGIQYVLDLTPEDEGEKAVEWQEKLWCPDIVLRWKSNLVDFDPIEPPTSEEEIAKTLEQFRQKEWGGTQPEGGEASSPTQAAPPPPPTPLWKETPSKKDSLPEPYSYSRHILALERLVHILHMVDPLVQSTIDWYTLHCLSVTFGTTDATRDYIARWIFSNTLIIETHPAFIWQVAVEAGLATIASDAFAAAVIRYNFDPEDALKIPGAPEAALALSARAQKEFKDILDVDWVDQYLPSNPSGFSTEDETRFEAFRSNLKGYVARQLKFSDGVVGTSLEGPIYPQAMLRNTWVFLRDISLCSETSSFSPQHLEPMSRYSLEMAITYWERWDTSMTGEDTGNDDLWRDVKLGAPQHPIASVTHQTTVDGAETVADIGDEDATSEIASQTGTEVLGYVTDDNDDVKSVSSTHTLNHAMRELDTKPDGFFHADLGSSSTLVNPAIPTYLQDNIDGGEQPSPPMFTMEVEDQNNNQNIGNNKPPFENIGFPSARTLTRLLPKSDNSAPAWLQEQLLVLSEEHSPAFFWALMHYPNNDSSRPPEPRIRCFDCPEMLYFAGPGESLQNFRIHLRNIGHMNRLQSRKIAEGLSAMSDAQDFDTNSRGRDFTTRNWRSPETSQPPHLNLAIEIPNGLHTILRLCETYIRTRCSDMTARNIVFEPILLEEQLACLEEAERAFMPLWSGGEAIPSGNRTAGANRGASGYAIDDDMSVNVSSVGVGSVCTASTASTTDSYIDIETPGASSSESVISVSDDDDTAMSASGGVDDDWVMDEDDEEDDSFEDDDDIYFS